MVRFRNSKSNYKGTPSKTILSEEYTHTEKEINGDIHMIGTKKMVNLCDETFAKNHFPNPKDYTLENLLASGANLKETNVEVGNTYNEQKEAEELSNNITKQENNKNE